MREGFGFIILHVSVQLSQQGLLTRLSFPKPALGTLVENQVDIGMRVNIWLGFVSLFHASF